METIKTVIDEIFEMRKIARKTENDLAYKALRAWVCEEVKDHTTDQSAVAWLISGDQFKILVHGKAVKSLRGNDLPIEVLQIIDLMLYN